MQICKLAGTDRAKGREYYGGKKQIALVFLF